MEKLLAGMSPVHACMAGKGYYVSALPLRDRLGSVGLLCYDCAATRCESGALHVQSR